MRDFKSNAARGIPWALAAITLILYWPVTTFQFLTYDDPDFVTANPHVRAGLSAEGFRWVWRSNVARNWHPVTMLTHMLDCALFGLKPAGPHLVNLLWHIANVLLLYALFRKLTATIWRPALVAALFAWHPLHVESVAWIAERKDVLSTFFWLGATWVYVDYAKAARRQWLFYTAAWCLLAIGLMCKPMLVTVPFSWLLLDFWPLRRWTRRTAARLVLEKIPFFALSAVSSIITYRIQQQGGSVLDVNNLPIADRLANALVSFLRYLGKMLWPANLNALYLRSGSWPVGLVVLSAIFVTVVTILAIVQWRRRPWLAVGWFWYLGTLVPVIGLVQAGMQTMADRYTYVPLIGIFMIIAWAAAEWARTETRVNRAVAAAALALIACLAVTRHQLQFWSDSHALYGRMLQVLPGNYLAHYNLGNLYQREHRTNDAVAEFTAALAAQPSYSDAHNNLGGILLNQRRYDEAIPHYREALRLNPGFLSYFNLANALADSASAHHDNDQFAEAVRMYAAALQLNPSSADAHYNLALTWQAQGRQSEAVEQFRQVVQLDPDRLEAWNQIAMSAAMGNRMAEAAGAFRQIIRLQPGNAAAYGNLGNALSAQNKFDEAIVSYRAALQLDPGNYQTEFNLALSFMREGRKADAESHFEEALRLHPDYPEAQRALAELRTSR